MNNIAEYKTQVDSLKRENYMIKRELELATEEIERMKTKKACGNCIGGCPQSEVTGYPCS